MIIEGANGTFVGSQDTLFKAYDLIREAMNNERAESSKKEEYLSAFKFIEQINGLTEDQKECYENLKMT